MGCDANRESAVVSDTTTTSRASAMRIANDASGRMCRGFEPAAATISSPSGWTNPIQATGTRSALAASAVRCSWRPKDPRMIPARTPGKEPEEMTNRWIVAGCVALLAACGGSENTTGQPEVDTTGSVQSAQQTSSATATTTGETGGTVSNLTDADKTFVSEAGMGGLAEV